MIKISNAGVITKIAVKAIWANKMRSALTSLGIIIGVAAVIAMIAIGSGAQKSIEDRVGKMGTNTITLRSGSAGGGGFSFDTTRAKYLTTDDVTAIEENLRTISAVYPSITTSRNIVSGKNGTRASIMGTTNTIFDVQPWKIASGRKFTPAEMSSASSVCIIGSETSKELFSDVDPIDQTIRLDGILYRIIGLLEPVGEGSWGFDPDNGIIVPISNAQSKMGMAADRPKYVAMITIQAKSYDLIEQTETDLIRLMRQRHRLSDKQDNDFFIMNLAQMLETMRAVTNTMTLLLGAIASISLLVGGIGIMNIMLVSVTERTREIGIRMAIGAGQWDIRLQFLTEAAILSVAGGLIGIFIGTAIAKAIERFGGMAVEITLFSVLLSFFVSALIGIGFGFYPAYKASKLNPIDALRYE